MNYIKIIYGLLGAALLLGISLGYWVLLPRGQTTLSSAQWLFFGSFALPLVLAAILPILIHRVRRIRGLAPVPLSASDLRFTIILSAFICPLTFFAVWMFPVYGTLVIMVVPLAFAIRAQQGGQPNQK